MIVDCRESMVSNMSFNFFKGKDPTFDHSNVVSVDYLEIPPVQSMAKSLEAAEDLMGSLIDNQKYGDYGAQLHATVHLEIPTELPTPCSPWRHVSPHLAYWHC